MRHDRADVEVFRLHRDAEISRLRVPSDDAKGRNVLVGRGLDGRDEQEHQKEHEREGAATAGLGARWLRRMRARHRAYHLLDHRVRE
jgi:hypothetical protein